MKLSVLAVLFISIFALTPLVAEARPDFSVGVYAGRAGGDLSCDDCDGLGRDTASIYGLNVRGFVPFARGLSVGAEAGFVTGPAANIEMDGENVADLRNRLGYFIPMVKISHGKISMYGGVGAGYSRSRYFDEELSDVSTRRPALVAKAGAELMLHRHLGLFADWQYSRVSDKLPDDGEKFRVKNQTSGVVGGVAVHF